MKVHVKAALLSAIILPGIGQLSKGAKIKGVVLILLVNLFLLAAMFMVLQGMGELLVTAKFSGMAAAEQVIEGLKGRGPMGRMLLAGFFGLWLYGVIDALFSRVEEGRPGE